MSTKMSSTFRYKTASVEERVLFFKHNNIDLKDNDTLKHPFRLLKKLPVEHINSTEELFGAYHFINTYQSIILKYILLIENSLKEAVAFVVGSKYGDHTYHTNKSINLSNDYLNISNYNTSKNIKDVEKILQDLKKILVKPPSYCQEIQKYKSRSNIPPYIAVSDLMLSSILNWYYILKDSDSKEVLSILLGKKLGDNNYKIFKQFFLISLRLLKEVRNKFAHSGGDKFKVDYKSITYKQLSLVFGLNDLSENIFEKVISKNKYNNYIRNAPYSVANICIFSILEPSLRNQFIQELLNLFENESVSLSKNNINNLITYLNQKEFIDFLNEFHYAEIDSEEQNLSKY